MGEALGEAPRIGEAFGEAPLVETFGEGLEEETDVARICGELSSARYSLRPRDKLRVVQALLPLASGLEADIDGLTATRRAGLPANGLVERERTAMGKRDPLASEFPSTFDCILGCVILSVSTRFSKPTM